MCSTHAESCPGAAELICPFVAWFCSSFQMPLLAEGIRIHGEKLTEQLKPLHDRLTACFKELRRKVEKQYGVITLVSQPGCAWHAAAPMLWPGWCRGAQGSCLPAASLPDGAEAQQGRLCGAALHHGLHPAAPLCYLTGIFCGLHILCLVRQHLLQTGLRRVSTQPPRGRWFGCSLVLV